MASEEAASKGDVAYFAALPDEQLTPQLTRKDEDGRTLLHTAAGAGERTLKAVALPMLQQCA